MKIGKYIHAVLSADNAVTDIIGDRLYPVLIPQQPENSTLPVTAVYMVNNQPHGQVKDFAGTYDNATVTFNLWADVSQGQSAYAQLEDLDAAIRAALDYVEGTAGGVTVESCRYQGSVDGRDDNNMYFVKTVTYIFVHRK